MNYKEQEQKQENEENLLEQMNQFKEEYYKTNSKNILFKNRQKKQYAETICNQFDVSVMIENTIKVLTDTNTVVVDYQIFKLFANENIYDLIINYAIQIFDSFILNNQTFYIQVNAKGLSVSAIERFKGFIKLMCMKTINKNYSIMINEISIYNAPNIIEQIMPIIKPLIEKGVYEKFRIR